jgi:simple sugar transport system ATP-binding protein
VKHEYAIELKNITKRFGEVVANDSINLSLKKGEILAILGENGSGKTTLMNVLSGIYLPDEGQIFINGQEAVISSPKDSFAVGIGMIHQHFKLINILSAAENIILGLQGEERLQMKSIVQEVEKLIAQYGFELDPTQKIYNMSVSQKQTVEIVKVLYRGAEILILDEPTAVLTPQETKKLFDVLRNMRKQGKSIIIITHKLNEVMELSDRVTVLRKGKYIETVDTKEATVESLTEMMVGEKISLDIDRTEPVDTQKRLELKGVTCRNKEGVPVLNKVSFEAYSGEILGIAGIAGSGQKELLESIAGLETIESGEILYVSKEGTQKRLSNMKPIEITNMNIHLAFVPEDRLGMGLVGSMDLTDNIMLRSYKKGKHLFVDRKTPKKLAQDIVNRLDVVTPNVDTPIRRLSGGNVQKVLLGREIASSPSVLMAAYAVRGLDIHSSYMIYNLLSEEKKKGSCVIYVGEDLDVLLQLCDKILVLAGGEVTGIVDARKSTKEEIGFMMTGTMQGGEKHV